MKDGELDELISTLNVEKGDCVFIVSGKTSDTLSILGALRLIVAKELDIIPDGKWNFLWITEISSGSMRITDSELQNKMFELLGMQQKEIDAKFGFLVEAYKYAAPPHGGMGIGLDRLAMLICGADSLRDVTAFPKVQNASELMSGAPSYIDDIQLDELGIAVTKEEKDEQ